MIDARPTVPPRVGKRYRTASGIIMECTLDDGTEGEAFRLEGEGYGVWFYPNGKPNIAEPGLDLVEELPDEPDTIKVRVVRIREGHHISTQAFIEGTSTFAFWRAAPSTTVIADTIVEIPLLPKPDFGLSADQFMGCMSKLGEAVTWALAWMAHGGYPVKGGWPQDAFTPPNISVRTAKAALDLVEGR